VNSSEKNLEIFGFDIIRSFLSGKQLALLIESTEKLKLKPRAGGIREIDKLIPEIGDFSSSEYMISNISKYLSSKPIMVRAIYFDKNPESNWLVTWHQDKTITVTDKIEIDGWGPWSVKNNVHHVQPPIDVLENMITIRIHLDDAKIENGCLKIIPRSHKYGLIKTPDITKYVENENPVFCEVKAGDAVFIRPHILHSSEKAKVIKNRRVLHFEYSSYVLPNGLTWVA